MHSLRKWFYRPKKEDSSKLASFYWADEELTMVATELDSFDGRTDPDRCSILVSQLRLCQDKVLGICNEIMDDAIPEMRANRDFRAKFPDDVLHENLAGQLWFGAECLAAGSNIIHRELESASMRPLAKALTRALDNVRCLLREQSLKNSIHYSEKVQEALRIFDRLFAEFELCYVSAMVPIKTAKEYHLQQEIIVLFSETLIRALKIGLVTQEMVDDYDPSLMFTIPRLAIVWGLLLSPDGPFSVEKDGAELSELFRPFRNLLLKIRDLLWTLTENELHALEKMLCSLEEPKADEKPKVMEDIPLKRADESVCQFYKKHLNCKQFIHDFYAYNFGILMPENGFPDHSEDNLLQEKHIVEKSECEKYQSRNIEFEMQFNASENKSHKIIADGTESDIETLVSSDFGVSDCDEIHCNSGNSNQVHFCRDANANNADQCDFQNGNEENMCVDEVAINLSPSNGMTFHCHTVSKQLSSQNCSSYSTEDEFSNLGHTSTSLENQLSRLHNNCTCGIDDPSRERLTPSREIMRQVMSRVEIVPVGQCIDGYSSSAENSPRAYHHGLLSHSYPTHPGHSQFSVHSDGVIRRMRRHSHYRSSNIKVHTHDADAHFRYYDAINQNAPHSIDSNWDPDPVFSSPLLIPRVQSLREDATTSEATYSSCSSCQSISSVSSPEWDSTSPDTSSYNSECQDDEEIALALQAAEIASRNKARSRFKSSRDLLHKLFVCVSGVADQLQTNYASDLRNILKSVFDINCTPSYEPETYDSASSDEPNVENQANNLHTNNAFNENETHNLPMEISSAALNNSTPYGDERDRSSVDSAEEVVPDCSSLVISELGRESENSILTGPPEWMPDELSSNCMACKVQFTILRRRHHCRNCGKIFCSRCSSNSIPLPRYGHLKPVRVCNQCFMYQLTTLVMQRQL